MKKLFSKDLSPACEYCRFGRLSPDASNVLCVKRGIMLPDSYCKSYKYDVLKRRPKKKAQIRINFSEEDFKL